MSNNYNSNSNAIEDIISQLDRLEIRLDSNCAIVQRPDSSFTVYSLSNDIPLRSKVATCPKNSTLSLKTCQLSSIITQNIHQSLLDNHSLALALAVWSEFILANDSTWATYLASLPPQSITANVAAIWDEHGQPYTWIKGTAVQAELQRVGTTRSTLLHLFHTQILPTLLPHIPLPLPLPTQPNLELLFLHSYALTTSRAFHLDNFHHLALVPLFDLFDHSTETSMVHLESHVWVCEVCGGWDDRCGHEDPSWSRPPPGQARNQKVDKEEKEEEEDSSIELVSHVPIPAHTEIFNTYGPALPNARLLVEYGFLSEANPWDLTTFSGREVWGMVGGRGEGRGELDSDEDEGEKVVVDEICALLRSLDEEGEEDDLPLVAPSQGSRSDGSSHLYFDADARVSVPLWVGLCWFNLKGDVLGDERGRTKADRVRDLFRGLGEVWETSQEGDEVADGADSSVEMEEEVSHPQARKDQNTSSSSDKKMLHKTATQILRLGRSKLARFHRPDLDGPTLLSLSDEEEDPPTKLAMKVSAEERIRIACVVQRWSRLVGFLEREFIGG